MLSLGGRKHIDEPGGINVPVAGLKRVRDGLSDWIEQSARRRGALKKEDAAAADPGWAPTSRCRVRWRESQRQC